MRHAWLLLAIVSLPAHAQTAAAPAASAAAAPDPARLEAAGQLLDTLMPAATRAQMMDGMLRPMMANMQRGITADPNFAKLIDNDPRGRAMFGRFMAQQTERTMESLRMSIPGMWEATTRAYARRFDVAQMRELKAFFETPTGRAYMQQSLTIKSDPDIAAWQQQMMRQSMARVQEDVASFAREAATLQQEKK